MIEKWKNIITGGIVFAEQQTFGSDDGYRVYIKEGLDYLWYSKSLFESWYEKEKPNDEISGC